MMAWVDVSGKKSHAEARSSTPQGSIVRRTMRCIIALVLYGFFSLFFRAHIVTLLPPLVLTHFALFCLLFAGVGGIVPRCFGWWYGDDSSAELDPLLSILLGC